MCMNLRLRCRARYNSRRGYGRVIQGVFAQYPQNIRSVDEQNFAETMVESHAMLIGGDQGCMPASDEVDIDDSTAANMAFLPT